MRIIKWQRSSRRFSDSEVVDFYERQLDVPRLFRFRTKHTELPEHGGEFSLKLVLSGQEEYRIGHRSVMLRPGQFLMINKGQHYSSRVLSETESVSIFFPAHERSSLLEAALQKANESFREDSDYSLNIDVPQITFSADSGAVGALSDLLHAIDHPFEADPREASQQMMIEAVRNLHRIAPFSKLKSVSKSATRTELTRRLLNAKEQIDDSVGCACDLDDLANTACLSKYYFLRLFTEMFGIAPGAYARKVRLKRAVLAIEKGARPKRAALAAGYRDLRAFRRACQRRLNLDPIKNSQFQTTSH